MKLNKAQFTIILFFSLLVNCVYSNSIDSIMVEGKFLFAKGQFARGRVYQFKSKKTIKSFKIETSVFSFKLPASVELGVYRVFYERE